jgi:ribosomal protein L20
MRSKKNTRLSKFSKLLKNKKFFGATSASYKKSRMRLIKALKKSTHDRHKKGNFLRRQNIIKINAFLSTQNIKYSEFINMIKKINCKINRTNILEILLNDKINILFIEYVKNNYNNNYVKN